MTRAPTIPAGFGRLCATAGLAGVGVGAVVPLISTHIAERGSADVTAGALATLYFAAQGVGALVGRRMPTRVLGISLLTFGLLAASLTTLAFDYAEGLSGWAVNRALAGGAMGLYMTAAQLQVMRRSQGPHQAKLNGLYALCFGGGFSLGPSLAVLLYDTSPRWAFVAAATAFLLAALLWTLRRGDTGDSPPAPHAAQVESRGTALPLFAVLSYGFCEASVFALFALYWLDATGGTAGLGAALGLFGVGSLVATLPVTSVADRLGARATLGACAAFGAGVLLLLPMASTPWVMQILCGLAGAAVGPCFALALSLLTQAAGPRIQASSGFTTAFSLGSVAGPLLSTSALHYIGVRQAFVPAALCMAAVAIAVVLRPWWVHVRSTLVPFPPTPEKPMRDTWLQRYRTSVVQGLRTLGGRSRGRAHFRELDGLRAIACMWVIALHTISNLGSFWVTPERDVRLLDRETFLDVERNPAIRWMVKGDLGVDMFFVLSGFLIARGLFKELRRKGSLDIPEFYVRRWMRLYPVFALAAIAYAVLEQENLENAWPTLFYVSNFVPALNQFMLHAWSLAVEWQFYILFPWLLLLLHRMRSLTPWNLALLVLACVGLRAWTVEHFQLHVGLAGHPAIDDVAAQRFNSLFYDELHVRFGGLLCGVVLAACAERGAIGPFFEKRRLQSWVWFSLLALLTVGILVPSPVPEAGAVPNETVVFVFLTLYQIAFAAFVAYVMAFMQSRSRFGGLLRGVLSMRWFAPLAQLSYGAYLLHPLIIKLTYQAGYVPSTEAWQFWAYGFGFMAAAFVVAIPVYVLVEFPLMHSLRGAAPVAATTPAYASKV